MCDQCGAHAAGNSYAGDEAGENVLRAADYEGEDIGTIPQSDWC